MQQRAGVRGISGRSPRRSLLRTEERLKVLVESTDTSRPLRFFWCGDAPVAALRRTTTEPFRGTLVVSMTLLKPGGRMLTLRMHTPLYPPQTSHSPFNPRASDLSRQHPDLIQDQHKTSQKHVSEQRVLGALLRRVRMLLGELRYRTAFVPDGGGEPSRKPHASSDASPAVRHESSAARLHPAVPCSRHRRHAHPPSSRAGSQPCRGDCAHS